MASALKTFFETTGLVVFAVVVAAVLVGILTLTVGGFALLLGWLIANPGIGGWIVFLFYLGRVAYVLLQEPPRTGKDGG